MVAPETLAAFAAASLAIELTPGPNMGYLALISAAEGRRAGFAAVAGVALGLALLAALSALGLAALVKASPLAYGVLRWGGILFLLWLAWDSWRDAGAADAARPGDRAFVHFRRGLVTNLLNPKAALFFLTGQPAFLPPAPPLADVATLGAVYVAVATAVHAAIAALAGTAHRLAPGAARQRVMRRAMALGLVAVAAWLWWKT